MHKRGLGCEKAMVLVKSCRPQIKPNPGFVDILKSLERASVCNDDTRKAEAEPEPERVGSLRDSSIRIRINDDERRVREMGMVVRACILALALRLSASMFIM